MAWVKLYDNGLQKRIFSIIFAIFYAAAKFATCHVSSKNFVKTWVHFSSIELI